MNKHNNALLIASLIFSSLSIYGSMAIMSMGAGFAFVVWLYFEKNSLKEALFYTFYKSPVFWPTFVLTLICAGSLLRAHFTDLEFMGMRPRINLAKDLSKLWHLWFPMVLASLFMRAGARGQKIATRAWLSGAVLAALLGVAQHYMPIIKPMPIPDPGLQHRYHATGLAGFHLSYASIMVFPTMVALSAVASFIKRRHLLWTILSAVVFFVAMLSGIYTYSKIYWVALPAAMIAVIIMRLRGATRAVAITSILVAATALAFHPAVKQRFGGIGTINDRLMLWDANLAMVKAYPLLGVGWHHNSELSGAYYRSEGIRALYSHINVQAFESHAHNNALDQWSSTGTLGLLAFLWWNAVVLLLAAKLASSGGTAMARMIGVGLLAGWIGFHINGVTQTNFWDSKVMHQMAWVVALSLAVKRKSEATSDQVETK
jgi:O-antigen ligase